MTDSFYTSGPLASLAVAISMICVQLQVEGEGVLAPAAYLCCGYAVFSFIRNLIPSEQKIPTDNGMELYTDGKQVCRLWGLRNMPSEYALAADHYLEKQYHKAAELLEGLIASGHKHPNVYRIASAAYMETGNEARAIVLTEAFLTETRKLQPEECTLKAGMMIRQGKYTEAIGYLKKLLTKGGVNKDNLNALGYALNEVGQYEEAIRHLNNAIALDPLFAHPYGNRSFALLQTGKLEEGKADNDKARELEPDARHGYDFRNEGVYFFYKGDYAAAMEALLKAERMDAGIPGLGGWLEAVLGSLRE